MDISKEWGKVNKIPNRCINCAYLYVAKGERPKELHDVSRRNMKDEVGPNENFENLKYYKGLNDKIYRKLGREKAKISKIVWNAQCENKDDWFCHMADGIEPEVAMRQQQMDKQNKALEQLAGLYRASNSKFWRWAALFAAGGTVIGAIFAILNFSCQSSG